MLECGGLTIKANQDTVLRLLMSPEFTSVCSLVARPSDAGKRGRRGGGGSSPGT